jgi:16S rRNA (cytosine1402-N4)-methyltransferase
MVREVVKLLAPKKGEMVLDATYGAGGHSKAIKRAAKVKLIAIDADPSAGVIVANFADIKSVLKEQKVAKLNKVLFDLGWRREQLASNRGFSFQTDEPLDMSYGPEPASGFRASDILNTWSERALADVLFGYGEERYARRIARAIVERRALMPIKTTLELVELVRDAVPPHYRHARLHPATKTFQALRIAVNDELRVLERGLAAAWESLACNGRIVVVTFHSIEDRLVKRFFVQLAKHEGNLLVKKPLVASRAEVERNSAARSAKVRAIEKICNK